MRRWFEQGRKNEKKRKMKETESYKKNGKDGLSGNERNLKKNRKLNEDENGR